MAVLHDSGVERLVDVRRFPGSRRHPHLSRERLSGDQPVAYEKVGHNGAGPEDPDDPPPFQGLEDASEAYTQTDGQDNDRDGTKDDADESQQLTDAENIFNFCSGTTVIGGNPEHGRFTCSDPGVAGPSTDSESDPECERNEKPGKG